MAVLGLLLLLSAAGLTLDVVLENTSSISVDGVGQTFSLSSGWLFVAGVATGAIGLLGVSMLVAGLARTRRHRAALVESTDSLQGLQVERDRLAEQLDRERAERTLTTTAPRQHGARTERDAESAVIDHDEAVIDLADDRPAEASADYAAVPSDAGPEPAADRHEPVGSGRHSLFHRRH